MTPKTVPATSPRFEKIELRCPKCGEDRLLERVGSIYLCVVCAHTFIPR